MVEKCRTNAAEESNIMSSTTTTEIASPKQADRDAEQPLACELALSAAFQELAERGHAAGWSQDDVAAALLELAHHHLSAIIADRKTKLDIEAAARSVM